MPRSPLPSFVGPKVCVIQDGARRHYAVPIAMERAGILERVYTDWYTRRGSIESLVTRLVKLISPGRAQTMAERFTPEFDAAKVRTKPSLMIRQILFLRRYKSEFEFFAMMRELAGRWILKGGFGESNGVYGFVRNISPAVCAVARDRGLKVVTDQMIAPFAQEYEENVLQAERFRDWSEDTATAEDRVLIDLERETWNLSDRVVCASDYVREGLIEQGVAASKVIVLPPSFRSGQIKPVDRRGRTKPLTVGFVGKVGLRKGAPYVFEVAKKFNPAEVRFVMVGKLQLHQAVADQQRGNVELTGAVPRGQIAKYLEDFDVFLFPSTCEGSAGVVNEAMAAGLPVVTSPNSGSLVRHGIEGFVSRYDDIDAMAEHIAALSRDAELRHQLGLAGRARVEEFSIDTYGQCLKDLYTGLLNPPQSDDRFGS